MSEHTWPGDDGPIIVNSTGTLCVALLIHLRRSIADAPAGTRTSAPSPTTPTATCTRCD